MEKKPKNRLNWKKPIEPIKILKKPASSVRFRFYKQKTEKTEPKQKNQKKTEPNQKNRAKPKKSSQTKKNQAKTGKNRTKTEKTEPGLNRFLP